MELAVFGVISFQYLKCPMSFDLPMNEKISTDHLSMKYLSDLDLTHTKSKLDALTSLVDLYRAWWRIGSE